MPTHIAFLRALNVGGRVYKMADLRQCLTDSGLKDVETYIQTGNVRFRAAMRSRAAVEKHVESTLQQACGFAVPAVVFSPAELRRVYDDALGLAPPFGEAPGQRRYVVFFKDGQAPTGDVAKGIEDWDETGEWARVRGRAVHVWLAKTTREAKFFGAFAADLKPGTNRDLKVVRTLAGRWGA